MKNRIRMIVLVLIIILIEPISGISVQNQEKKLKVEIVSTDNRDTSVGFGIQTR